MSRQTRRIEQNGAAGQRIYNGDHRLVFEAAAMELVMERFPATTEVQLVASRKALMKDEALAIACDALMLRESCLEAIHMRAAMELVTKSHPGTTEVELVAYLKALMDATLTNACDAQWLRERCWGAMHMRAAVKASSVCRVAFTWFVSEGFAAVRVFVRHLYTDDLLRRCLQCGGQQLPVDKAAPIEAALPANPPPDGPRGESAPSGFADFNRPATKNRNIQTSQARR